MHKECKLIQERRKSFVRIVKSGNKKRLDCRSGPTVFKNGINQRLAEVDIQTGDAVDLQIEVRSGTELGLSEVTIMHDLGVGGVVSVGIDVGHVRGQGLALDGEGGGVIDMELTGFQLGHRRRYGQAGIR